MIHHIKFSPAPNVVARPYTATGYGPKAILDAWADLKETIGFWFDCSPTDVSVDDASWRDGMETAICVVIGDRVVGSIDQHLTPSEWREVFASRIAEAEARAYAA